MSGRVERDTDRLSALEAALEGKRGRGAASKFFEGLKAKKLALYASRGSTGRVQAELLQRDGMDTFSKINALEKALLADALAAPTSVPIKVGSVSTPPRQAPAAKSPVPGLTLMQSRYLHGGLFLGMGRPEKSTAEPHEIDRAFQDLAAGRLPGSASASPRQIALAREVVSDFVAVLGGKPAARSNGLGAHLAARWKEHAAALDAEETQAAAVASEHQRAETLLREFRAISDPSQRSRFFHANKHALAAASRLIEKH